MDNLAFEEPFFAILKNSFNFIFQIPYEPFQWSVISYLISIGSLHETTSRCYIELNEMINILKYQLLILNLYYISENNDEQHNMHLNHGKSKFNINS